MTRDNMDDTADDSPRPNNPDSPVDNTAWDSDREAFEYLKIQRYVADDGACRSCGETAPVYVVYERDPEKTTAGYDVDNMGTYCDKHVPNSEMGDLTRIPLTVIDRFSNGSLDSEDPDLGYLDTGEEIDPDAVDVDIRFESPTPRDSGNPSPEDSNMDADEVDGQFGSEFDTSTRESTSTTNGDSSVDTGMEANPGFDAVPSDDEEGEPFRDSRLRERPVPEDERYDFGPFLKYPFRMAKAFGVASVMSVVALVIGSVGAVGLYGSTTGFSMVASGVATATDMVVSSIMDSARVFAGFAVTYTAHLVYRDVVSDVWPEFRAETTWESMSVPMMLTVSTVGLTVSSIAVGMATQTSVFGSGVFGSAFVTVLGTVAYLVFALHVVMASGTRVLRDSISTSEWTPVAFAWDASVRVTAVAGVLSVFGVLGLSGSASFLVTLTPAVVVGAYEARRAVTSSSPTATESGDLLYAPGSLREKLAFRWAAVKSAVRTYVGRLRSGRVTSE